MARENLLTAIEEEKIKELYNSIKNIRKVAALVNRDPKSVRKIVHPKELQINVFDWKYFDNSIIL